MCHSLTNFLDSEIKVRHFHLKQLVTSSETCRYLKKQQQNHRSLSPLSGKRRSQATCFSLFYESVFGKCGRQPLPPPGNTGGLSATNGGGGGGM